MAAEGENSASRSDFESLDPTHEDERGNTELARLRRNYSRASTAHATDILSDDPTRAEKVTSLPGKFTAACRSFWRHQISVTVDHRTCRDHLALERTFLGYLRTSLALSMMGIVVAQLFRLQHAPKPHPTIGFYVLGKPLSCICQGAAIYTLLIGAFRTWRTQNAVVRGKAITGGFEIVALAFGIFLLLLIFLVLLVTVNILKEDLTSSKHII
ncbi:hypothetical protein GLAREA_08405 [Glarea lozoyensis ATCC 20868]|uniref:DUF202 domain-containing protein n=1 Tax=Glarea lozoyensis (strain ATCC 20868 / MF5171) TaxID=1116229 RepID=S3DCY3_GLAL2|nr:uncharacterized protein GLAREA_08405 [Glarea lozoyensis ATCC 20868]EPE24553.1 hypothetical protein GLAREA_08405 [Glarea lozoyensis ATCC 20868]